MPAFTTVLSIAAVAGSLVQAAPLAIRNKPATYYEGYLESYATYHLRYIALDCEDQHNTSFFDQCCHPLLSTESLSDRPSQCTPSSDDITAASAYISSTAVNTASSSAAWESATASATTTALSEEASEYSVAEVSYTSAMTSTSSTPSSTSTSITSTSSTSTEDALTTEGAYAHAKTTTTTSSAAAAAATTSSSTSSDSSGTETGGWATFFYQNGNPGACGNVHADSDSVIAIDSAWWHTGGAPSEYCGKWITITNTNNGKSVSAMVADECPTCNNGNSLDLSVGAFTQIASESDGIVPITWSFN